MQGTIMCQGTVFERKILIWSPHALGDIDKIEGTQQKYTMFLPGLFNVPYYMNQLEIVRFETLEI